VQKAAVDANCPKKIKLGFYLIIFTSKRVNYLKNKLSAKGKLLLITKKTGIFIINSCKKQIEIINYLSFILFMWNHFPKNALVLNYVL